MQQAEPGINPENERTVFFTDLPLDILIDVLSYLVATDIIAIRQVKFKMQSILRHTHGIS
jgi:hypothetical protein